MSKMKVSGSKIVDIGELMREIEQELTNKDSFDLSKDYDRGMHDELRWVRNKLRGLEEIKVVTKGEMLYEQMR